MELAVPNPNTELRHAAARDCVRRALRVLWPTLGAREAACRAHLEKALAALGDAGPPVPPVPPLGPALTPTPAKKLKQRGRRHISTEDTVPFPEGWDRRAD